MSRSTRLPVLKDSFNFNYNKVIRSKTNNIVRMMKYNEELEIPDHRTIVNSYDICDWKWRLDPQHKEYLRSQRK